MGNSNRGLVSDKAESLAGLACLVLQLTCILFIVELFSHTCGDGNYV